MTCHVRRAMDVIFLLQTVHEPIVDGMRRFICASEFGNLVAGQGTPTVAIEGVSRGAIDIL